MTDNTPSLSKRKTCEKTVKNDVEDDVDEILDSDFSKPPREYLIE